MPNVTPIRNKQKERQHMAENGIFGERLQGLIETLGLKQGDFAITLGVSEGTVSSWLSGKSEPKWSQLQKVISTFHINPARLFEWE